MRVLTNIEKAVNGVVLGNIAISLSHAFVTYAFFLVLGLDFVYITTFITAFTALFPFVSSWMVILFLSSHERYLYLIFFFSI